MDCNLQGFPILQFCQFIPVNIFLIFVFSIPTAFILSQAFFSGLAYCNFYPIVIYLFIYCPLFLQNCQNDMCKEQSGLITSPPPYEVKSNSILVPWLSFQDFSSPALTCTPCRVIPIVLLCVTTHPLLSPCCLPANSDSAFLIQVRNHFLQEVLSDFSIVLPQPHGLGAHMVSPMGYIYFCFAMLCYKYALSIAI